MEGTESMSLKPSHSEASGMHKSSVAKHFVSLVSRCLLTCLTEDMERGRGDRKKGWQVVNGRAGI